MKACGIFPLKLSHQGDCNEYTQHAIIGIKKKITPNYPKYNNVGSYGSFSLRTQERVRKSRGKRAIGVRATEVLLYHTLIGENMKSALERMPTAFKIVILGGKSWVLCLQIGIMLHSNLICVVQMSQPISVKQNFKVN